ncbi:MAG: hypothetical protein AB7V77_03195, partial [Candidatus Woesearchaeota archaeon]
YATCGSGRCAYQDSWACFCSQDPQCNDVSADDFFGDDFGNDNFVCVSNGACMQDCEFESNPDASVEACYCEATDSNYGSYDSPTYDSYFISKTNKVYEPLTPEPSVSKCCLDDVYIYDKNQNNIVCNDGSLTLISLSTTNLYKLNSNVLFYDNEFYYCGTAPSGWTSTNVNPSVVFTSGTTKYRCQGGYWTNLPSTT